MSDSKTCSYCKEEKPNSEYSRNQGVCKKCRAVKSKQQYEKLKQQKLKQQYEKQKQQKEAQNIQNQQTCICCTEIKNESDFDSNPICKKCFTISEKFKELRQPDQKQNTYVYLITCPLFLQANRYKIGMHTGTIDKLKTRYCTAFPDLQVLRFWKTENPRYHEKKLHHICKLFRQNNSEWFESVEIPNLFDNYVQSQDESEIINSLTDENLNLYEKTLGILMAVKSQDAEKIQDAMLSLAHVYQMSSYKSVFESTEDSSENLSIDSF